MHSSVGNNINAIRIHCGYTQAQLAEYLNVSQTTISSWENGGTRPRAANVEPLYSLVPGLTYDDIWGEDNGFATKAPKGNPVHGKGLIPLYGSISAGQSLDMLPIMEFVDINEQLLAAFPQAFFLRVNGESMNRVLPNGCLALVDPLQREPLSGAIFALRVDASEATVKRLRLEGSTLTLLPCSTDPSFEETELSWTAESQASVQILGRVVWYCLPPDERL